MAWRCADPAKYQGQVVGDGQCVRFCQAAVPGLPHTSQWRRGAKVKGGNIEPGTVIATFGASGKYENKTDGSSHAAILVAEEAGGLRVWDQWVGRPVAERLIFYRGGAGRAVNDGDRFFVVEAENA